jgi:hypothetical protein
MSLVTLAIEDRTVEVFALLADRRSPDQNRESAVARRQSVPRVGQGTVGRARDR